MVTEEGEKELQPLTEKHHGRKARKLALYFIFFPSSNLCFLTLKRNYFAGLFQYQESIFFNGHIHSLWDLFLGQGWNPSHGCSNTRSLTHCATAVKVLTHCTTVVTPNILFLMAKIKINRCVLKDHDVQRRSKKTSLDEADWIKICWKNNLSIFLVFPSFTQSCQRYHCVYDPKEQQAEFPCSTEG